MPTYQYRCTECGEPLEVVQKFTDPALTECPNCSGRLRKVFSPVGVVFKGSGFYKTDSRAAEKARAGAAGGKDKDGSAAGKDGASGSDGAAAAKDGGKDGSGGKDGGGSKDGGGGSSKDGGASAPAAATSDGGSGGGSRSGDARSGSTHKVA